MQERATLERETSRLRGEALEPDREVFDPDTREPVKNSTLIPFRWVCHVQVEYPDPDKRYETALWAGTGLLIGPRHVLTAAHALVSEDGRKVARAVTVAPGRNGPGRAGAPVGTVGASAWKVHPRWRVNGRFNRRFDYALLVLEDRVADRRFSVLGNRALGHWGSATAGYGTRLQPVDPTSYAGGLVNSAGYPSDRPFGTLWRAHGTMRLPHPSLPLAHHTIDTKPGQSGAPIWSLRQGRRELVGVHVAPVTVIADDKPQPATANAAVLVTPVVHKQVTDWIAASP